MIRLAISLHRSCNSLARRAFGIVVDIFGRIEFSTDLRERPYIPSDARATILNAVVSENSSPSSSCF